MDRPSLIKIVDISDDAIEVQTTAISQEAAKQRLDRWMSRNIIRNEGEVVDFFQTDEVTFGGPAKFKATIEV